MGGKNVPDAKNVPDERYFGNNSATQATIHKQIGARESPREEKIDTGEGGGGNCPGTAAVRLPYLEEYLEY